MSAAELVQFWSSLGGENIHPSDVSVLPSNQFETRLAPVPWAGPINTASVFILMLNPGLSPEDIPYESGRGAFVNALRLNLSGDLPYLYFIRGYEEHPGHRWARGTFGWDLTTSDADKFCALQLVPYHSSGGEVARKIASRLPSSLAVQQFVRHSVLPRARRGEIGLVVARSSALWGLTGEREDQNVLIYQGAEPRRAYMTPGSRGGALLRRWLAR
jgi:hypothetical protein